MQALISVIVPVYNTERYLDQCIGSIIDQSYQNLEIILIDDGSTDGSSEKCDCYAQKEPRIRVIHKKNGGQSSARNVGLDICKGEYISFVDSDDWIASDMYATLLGQLEKYNASLAICGRYDAFEGSEEKTVGKVLGNNGLFDSYDILPKMTMGQASDFSVCDKLYRRDLWKNVRFPNGEIYEDFAVMYKILITAQKVVLCDTPFYVYFHRKNSTVTSGFREASTDYPKQTRQFLSDIILWYPEYMGHAIWAHIKAIQCVLIDLLKSDKATYSSHSSVYDEYICDIIKYSKIWKKNPLFTSVDRLLCWILLHKRLARGLFLLKKWFVYKNRGNVNE